MSLTLPPHFYPLKSTTFISPLWPQGLCICAATESATVTEPWLELASGAGKHQPRKARGLHQENRGPHDSKKERGETALGARVLGTPRSPNGANPFWKLIFKKKAEDAKEKVGARGKARHTEGDRAPQ